MGQSQEPEPETPHKRIQRKICEQYNYYTDASRAAKKTIRDHCNRYYEKYGRWKYVKKTISVIMVIGVGIYTLVTFCLYKIAQQQLMISRDTEIMQLRAYIGISNIDFGQTVNSENKKFFDWFIIPTIENGATRRLFA